MKCFQHDGRTDTDTHARRWSQDIWPAMPTQNVIMPAALTLYDAVWQRSMVWQLHKCARFGPALTASHQQDSRHLAFAITSSRMTNRCQSVSTMKRDVCLMHRHAALDCGYLQGLLKQNSMHSCPEPWQSAADLGKFESFVTPHVVDMRWYLVGEYS